MMSAAYRGCTRLSTHILCLLREGDAVASGAAAIRDRYVYAPAEGVFRTKARIGDAVRAGQEIAEIGPVALTVPLDGVLRGLTHDGAPVTLGTKVIEVDPRGRVSEVWGIAERPRQIAEGVLSAIRTWEQRPRR